jgi:glutathione synthase/RimK-type ligase-like ATP-grasp enzyme
LAEERLILLCGIPSEPPLLRVINSLKRRKSPCVILNQREFKEWAIQFEVTSEGVKGELRRNDRAYNLCDITAVYMRMMDDQDLPELEDEPENSTARRYAQALHESLYRWVEVSPALVINRPSAMASNSSKPYQMQLIARHGFLVPETLITNDPETVRAFKREFGRIIYKSASGTRSIVQDLSSADEERLDRIRWCPTMFQEFIDGTNIRVHTVGSRVFATAIESSATDYRYATQQVGRPAALREVTLTPSIAKRCLQLARSLNLEFAGIDLKVTPDDRVYCFEVNPLPAYSYFELNTGQRISTAVAHRLAFPTEAALANRL